MIWFFVPRYLCGFISTTKKIKQGSEFRLITFGRNYHDSKHVLIFSLFFIWMNYFVYWKDHFLINIWRNTHFHTWSSTYNQFDISPNIERKNLLIIFFFRHQIQTTTNIKIQTTSKDLQRLTVVVRHGDKQQRLQVEKLTSDFRNVVEYYSKSQKVCNSPSKNWTNNNVLQPFGWLSIVSVCPQFYFIITRSISSILNIHIQCKIQCRKVKTSRLTRLHYLSGVSFGWCRRI